MKLLPYSVVALVLLAALVIAVLSVPRLASYAILFPEKHRLNTFPIKAGEEARIISALDAAISWWDAPKYFYLKEALIGERIQHAPYVIKKKYYTERMNLIENGLLRGAIEPYKLARLARLYILSESDHKIGLAALQLSANMGGNVRNLYMPRFITLLAMWDNLSKSEKENMQILVLKAINYDRSALIKFAKTNSEARVMVREVLKDDPVAFLQYVRDYLRH